ncbi:hypothetical protein [Virgibacillus sp. MG-45]
MKGNKLIVIIIITIVLAMALSFYLMEVMVEDKQAMHSIKVNEYHSLL